MKKVKQKNIIIGVLVLLLGLYIVYIGYDKLTNNTENTNKDNNNNIDNNLNITKVSIEQFLSLMVDNDKTPYDNIYEIVNYLSDDHATFIRIIRILLATNNYEKVNDVYYFNSKDVKEYAKKYFGKNDFNYLRKDDSNFTFDNESKKYHSKLEFGIFDVGPTSYSKLSVTNFTINNNTIIIKCSIKTTTYSEIITYNYLITLNYEDNSYIIKSIVEDK